MYIMSRREAAQLSKEIFNDYIFIPKRKRGRQKALRENCGRHRAVDAGKLILLIDAYSHGCTDVEARLKAMISRTAYENFCALNKDFKTDMRELRENPTLVARYSVYAGMKKSGELALKYLERKLPEEFSLKAVVQHNLEFTGITLDKPKLIEQKSGEDEATQVVE